MKKLSILFAGTHPTKSADCNLVEQLKAQGIHVHKVFNIMDVLDIVKRKHSQLIIMSNDKKFEEQLHLLEEIRQFNRYIPIIMLVNQSSEDEIISAFRSGATDYIRPPVTLDAVMESVERCHQHFPSCASSVNGQQKTAFSENLKKPNLVGNTLEM